MNTGDELSPSAQKVQTALSALDISFQVVELPASTRTAQEAAQTIGCTVNQIVKSLIFQTKQTKKPIIVLASGSNRINEKKVGEVVAEPIEKANADFVREKTGFVIGGVPPMGHKEKIETYIDEDLLQYEELWAAAGTPNAVFKLRSTDIEKLTNGKVISVK
ncbi:MAG: YbaK/EbsC family protein [Nostoc sp.]|uniref:YbaK/EbsC family protein n=1 Tax=Nostoc sp. TaxID=1180 RepID=UPI002FFA9BB5